MLDWKELKPPTYEALREASCSFWASLYVSEECFASIRRYRVHQEATGRTTIEIVPRGPLPEEDLARLRDVYRSLLGPRTPVEVRIVDRLDAERSRKFRMFTSERLPAS